jgi:twinkle protein
MERDSGNSLVVAREPCPKCGSKNNLVRYADGHAHCFTPGCGHFERGEKNVLTHSGDIREGEVPGRLSEASQRGHGLLDPSSGQWGPLDKRRLDRNTLQRYGYHLAHHGGGTVHVAPYYSQEGKLVAQKLRYENKRFTVLKAEGYETLARCRLFGQQVFGDRFDRRVVVTEGELDAMSVAQAFEFKIAAVSVNTGAAGAADCLKANYRWLDRFEEIVLWFDDDEAGKKAAEESSKLFRVGKVKIAVSPGHKDASEALQANKPGDIQAAVYGAETWRPRGIVNGADCGAAFEQEENEAKWSYPWPILNEMTAGITAGQYNLLVAGTGMGKSVIWSELIVDLAHRQGAKVGYMAFEATLREAMEGLMSIKASKRVHLEEISKEEKLRWHKATFGSRKIELYDQETAERSLDAILSYVRYMAKGLDCQIVVVDPLSFVVAGVELAADERRVLDKVSRDFAAMAKELGIVIFVSHHLSRPRDGRPFEEGRHITLDNIRGSGSIAHFASTVIGLEGNQQGSMPTLRRFRIAKCRRAGRTGVADRLEFSFATGRYTTTQLDYEEAEANDKQQSVQFGGAGAGQEY